jgi:dephospho-CoA kinase
MVIGVTGGIACGKSSIGKVIQRLGARIIEADEIGWEILEKDEIKENILEAFGREYIGTDNKIDRKRIGKLLFENKEELVKFNAIVHPPLLTNLKEKIENDQIPLSDRQAGFAKGGKRGILAVVATLIAEWKIEDWFDSIICVTSPTDLQTVRLVEKGFTREEAENRIESQLPQSVRVKTAEFILRNDTTLRNLEDKAREIFEILRKREIESLNHKITRD